MAGIQVIAGNFPKGWASFGFGTIVFGKNLNKASLMLLC